MNKTKSRNLPKMIFFVAIISLVALIIFSVNRVLIPLGISYILSLVIKPIKKQFQLASIGKRVMLTIFVLFSITVVVLPFSSAIKSVSDEVSKLEYYVPKLETYLRLKYDIFQDFIFQKFSYQLDFTPVDSLFEFAESTTKSVLVYLPTIVGSLLEWGFIIPLFLFFILRDSRKLTREVLKLVPNNIAEKVYFLIYRFNTKFGDYIFAKSIEALIVGFMITTGLLIMGYPFAFILGIVAAITNILPYIGPFIGFVPALVIGLSGGYDDSLVLAMVILYMVANIIDLAIVFPILVSKIVNLHPIVVVLSVIIGSQFIGVVGMIISIPIAAFFKILFEQIYSDIYNRPTSF